MAVHLSSSLPDLETVLQRYYDLTLRPFSGRIKHLRAHLHREPAHVGPRYVCEVVADLHQHRPAIIRSRHSRPKDAVALAFVRARRELSRRLEAPRSRGERARGSRRLVVRNA